MGNLKMSNRAFLVTRLTAQHAEHGVQSDLVSAVRESLLGSRTSVSDLPRLGSGEGSPDRGQSRRI
jgi:hypothetical protein